MIQSLKTVMRRAAEVRPLVHTITNNITVNDCANIILAAYGAPTMAQDVREVAEITARSHALVLNLGALRAQEAMLRAGRQAGALGLPVVLDPVGAGASSLRMEISRTLMQELDIAVIRGNASEIRALALGSETTLGVAASESDRVTEENLADTIAMLRAFSQRTGAVVCQTGRIDLVTDGVRTAVLRGGCDMMSRITGTGCMLTALIGVYCGASPDCIFEGAVAAVGALSVCGEQADHKVQQMGEGTASFRTRLIDAVSMLTPEVLAEQIKLEII